ncbi:MAG: tRNA 2-thiouridine(34) synthase MnmA [Clostridiales bacterium]|jgi:tRNA-specific 2-thiouridylase|nr:tRNA 2-thiouridine(34) synthase MnmA [Clostridiales bacterium]
MKKKVIAGMSGGVDSSVAAWLLLSQGHSVIGVTMQVWQDEDLDSVQANAGCCGLSAVEDARRVCQRLDIPYYVLNFKAEFKRDVIDYFIREYLSARTPNPCIACNRHVKWESLLRKAEALGADCIATGHYARIATHPETGRLCLRKSATPEKDQTYALYSLTQRQLERTITPIGDFTKAQVRQMAEDAGLAVARKPDSQEICFIPDNDYAGFIQRNSPKNLNPGWFVSVDGERLGRHKGITCYTIGQRKGLGSSFGKKMFVKKIDAQRNEVVLSDESELYRHDFEAEDVNWMAIEPFAGEKKLKAKIRYSHKEAECYACVDGEKVMCRFLEPQRAITPGQAAVFYDGDYVAFGGTISL